MKSTNLIEVNVNNKQSPIRPRGDIGRKNNNGNIPYVRDNDPVRTQSLSRTYAIMIPYVRNHYLVRTQCIPYVRNHYPVRTQ